MNIKRNLVKAALVLGCTVPLVITTPALAGVLVPPGEHVVKHDKRAIAGENDAATQQMEAAKGLKPASDSPVD